jgi:hypothetical protein
MVCKLENATVAGRTCRDTVPLNELEVARTDAAARVNASCSLPRLISHDTLRA